MAIKVPDYEEAHRLNERRDAIADFVWEYTPAGSLEQVFYKDLQAVVDQAFAAGKAAGLEPVPQDEVLALEYEARREACIAAALREHIAELREEISKIWSEYSLLNTGSEMSDSDRQRMRDIELASRAMYDSISRCSNQANTADMKSKRLSRVVARLTGKE